MMRKIIISMLFIAGLEYSILLATEQNKVDCSFWVSKDIQKITTEMLLSEVVKQVEPAIPSGFGRIDTKVVVTLVIDSKGTVVCVNAARLTHPILKKYSEEAALQWIFNPFLSNGDPIEVTGEIVFYIKR